MNSRSMDFRTLREAIRSEQKRSASSPGRDQSRKDFPIKVKRMSGMAARPRAFDDTE